MNRYTTFLLFFIISTLAFIVFMVVYLQAVFNMMTVLSNDISSHANPFFVFGILFTPAVIISGILQLVASLVYRILGIVYVAKNKTISDGEKALWIVGFILMGFITAIVFLVMAKGRKFV